jgi:PAS domain S-box-containing protein
LSRPPAAIALCDAKGAVTWASEALARLCGAAPAALAGRDVRALAAASGLELALQPLPPSAAGGVALVAVATDPADVGRAEAELVESEERYRRLVESCPEPIVVHSGGRIRFINPAGASLLGAATAEELLGRPIMEFVHPDFHGVVAERVRKMEETGEGAYLLEEKIVRLDGAVVDVEIAGAAISYRGERAIQLVGRDVTERNQAEEERRRLADRAREARRRASLAALAEGAAQQLADLSQVVVETADRALAQAGDAARGTGFLAVRRAGLRMARLTESLRAYAGKRPGVIHPVDLSALMVEISSGLENEVGSGIAITYQLPAELPRALVDPVQIRRVAFDLVRNAADALAEGPRTITVRTGALEADQDFLAGVQPPDALAPGPYVLLEVQDHGRGMDAETRARSLDPFFTTKAVGRGLGLCEAFGLVRAQGGGIRIESTPRRGTTVTVLLPAQPRATAERAPRRKR